MGLSPSGDRLPKERSLNSEAEAKDRSDAIKEPKTSAAANESLGAGANFSWFRRVIQVMKMAEIPP